MPSVHLSPLFNIFTSSSPQHAPITPPVPFMPSFRLYLPKQLPVAGWGLFPFHAIFCFLWQTDGSVRSSVCKTSRGEAGEPTSADTRGASKAVLLTELKTAGDNLQSVGGAKKHLQVTFRASCCHCNSVVKPSHSLVC